MHTTLRWKKTIAILAIILGLVRFVNGVSTFAKIAELEEYIEDHGMFMKQDILQDIEYYISYCKNSLPFNLIALAIIFILGITLLCVDKGLTDKEPRRKSRQISIAILTVTIAYLLLEIFFYCAAPSSLIEGKEFSIFLSFGWVILLIIFCAVGLRSQVPNILPNKAAETNLSPLERAIFDEIKAQPIAETEPKPTPLSPLDAEIEQLKKSIEKRKLEKELAQLNAEKQAEIEQLKKELAELE